MRRLFFLACLLLASSTLAGCGGGSQNTNVISYQIVDKKGQAALQFSNWVLVLEGVSTKETSVGSGGKLNYPIPGGSGQSESSIGSVNIKQSWNAVHNVVNINGCEFKLTDEGQALQFGETRYEAKSGLRTIILHKDCTITEMKGN